MQRNKLLMALAVAGSLGGAALPASADGALTLRGDHFSARVAVADGLVQKARYRGRESHRLSERDVRRILRRSGYREISRPDYRPRRDVFVSFAETRRGRDVRIVVDARNGEIVRVRQVGEGRQRLSAREVRRTLRRRGFHDISRPDYRPRRDVWVVRAENRRDRDVRVVVDARRGEIIDVDRIRRDGRRDGRRGGWR